MPPPMAPAESICIIMKPGKTSAMPASASVPSLETHQVSIKPVDACAVITRMFGHASSSNVGMIAPFSRRRVRGLIAPGAAAGAGPCGALARPGNSAARVLMCGRPSRRGARAWRR
jgi:hypothetical protein